MVQHISNNDPKALTVVNVKAITAVVAMVPNFEATVDENVIILENRFSLMESPFLKLAMLCGTLGQDNDICLQ